MSKNPFPFDPAPVVARARQRVKAAAARLHLHADEDINAMPIKYVTSKRVKCLCGRYETVSANGMGRIVVFTATNQNASMFEETVVHEFAHALVHWKGKPDTEDDHGKTWQYVMTLLGEMPFEHGTGPCPAHITPESIYQKGK